MAQLLDIPSSSPSACNPSIGDIGDIGDIENVANGREKRIRSSGSEVAGSPQVSKAEVIAAMLEASPDVLARVTAILRGEQMGGELASGPLLLGMGEGAKLLGVSRATLWRIIRAGLLPKVELLPGSYRIRRADVMALVAGTEVN